MTPVIPYIRYFRSIIIFIALLVPRLFIFIDGLFSYLTHTLLQKVFPPQFPVKGSCKQRGVCCRNVAIQISADLWRFKVLRYLAIKWYSVLYNFNLKGIDLDTKTMLFRCNYLKNNLCSIHWRRPFICRRYPQTSFFSTRRFLPGCGYYQDKGNHSTT
jgi:hypothetical protein